MKGTSKIGRNCRITLVGKRYPVIHAFIHRRTSVLEGHVLVTWVVDIVAACKSLSYYDDTVGTRAICAKNRLTDC